MTDNTIAKAGDIVDDAAERPAADAGDATSAGARDAVADRPIVLHVEGLAKSFEGLKAVDGISFDLHRGEVLSIIGPNGSGKSTTINLLSGFLKPDAGTIELEGRSIAGLHAPETSAHGLARTFQNGRVFGSMTVAQNVALGYHKKLTANRPARGLQRIPVLRWIPLLGETAASLVPWPSVRRENKAVAGHVDAEIERFAERLGPRRDDAAYTLSYANRRRTEIARALVSGPTLLLLDEPTAGMNQSETAEMLHVLQRLKAQGHTILLVEHKIELVTALSDRVLAMDGGRIIAQGDPDEVRRDPQVVEAYLGKRRPSRPAASASDSDSASDLAHGRWEGQSDVLAKENAIDRESGSGSGSAGVDADGAAPTVVAGPATEGARRLDSIAPLLALDDVNVYYGQAHALQGVTIRVPEGAIVSLLGGNASGKSTTMKTILGLKEPKTGRVLYQGRDITRESTRDRVRGGIAAVPEARRIFPEMTVRENLLVGAYTRTRAQAAQVREDVERMYERFPRLKERRNQKAGTMSGGEQQMLAFARALMSHPRVICMDEPTMGLSPRLVEDVLEQIVRLRDELGVSVLMVEQQAELALSVADYGYVLQNGRIRLHGAASDLLDDPEVQEAYLGGAR
ncbi:ATP-binding cassette domain-containing protein [Pseudoscardovia radai]|uniref:ATP-binding cassette domain-containing protein n=1 Tax=Pseudoscardovia radai TaxID=987066 RepID=UPI00399617DC